MSALKFPIVVVLFASVVSASAVAQQPPPPWKTRTGPLGADRELHIERLLGSIKVSDAQARQLMTITEAYGAKARLLEATFPRGPEPLTQDQVAQVRSLRASEMNDIMQTLTPEQRADFGRHLSDLRRTTELYIIYERKMKELSRASTH